MSDTWDGTRGLESHRDHNVVPGESPRLGRTSTDTLEVEGLGVYGVNTSPLLRDDQVLGNGR